MATTDDLGGGTPRKRIWKWRWGGRLLSAVVLLATFFALRDRWEGIGESASWPHVGWVLLAVLLNVGGNLLLVDAWRVSAALAGPRLRLLVAADVWGSSQLTRLLVPAAPVASRAVLAAQHGVPRGIATLTTLVELAWMLVGTPFMVLATIPWWAGDSGASLRWVAAFAVLPVMGLAAVLLRPRWSLDALASTMARLPVVGKRMSGTAQALRSAPFDRRAVLGLVWRHAANTLLRLAAFLVLMGAIVGGATLVEELPVAIGAFALGHIVGMVALFAPGGIGPREGATALVLGPRIGGGPALVLVGFARLAEFVAELVLLGGVRALRLVERGRTDPERTGS